MLTVIPRCFAAIAATALCATSAAVSAEGAPAPEADARWSVSGFGTLGAGIVADDDRGALLGQCAGRGGADAVAGARDEGGFAAKAVPEHDEAPEFQSDHPEPIWPKGKGKGAGNRPFDHDVSS